MSQDNPSTPPSLRRTVATLDARVDRLAKKGVVIVDPRQCFVDDAVLAENIAAGAVLWPGTRLLGARTVIGPGCEVGTEGPATIKDSVLERDVQVASGFVDGSLCLAGVKIGAQAHVRPGCILEEGVSVAHCVGLKQTILLSYVTLGSLINFCDCLMAGGTSEKVHAEVGSGYIHFNFTPWGERGDKATASLVGDVVRGVFLDQPRIFLGGMGGMVGPRNVGFGSVAAAGQVLRRDLAPGRLQLQPSKGIDREWQDGALDAVESRAQANRAYIAQLVALGVWYDRIRRVRAVQRQDVYGERAARQGQAILEAALAERFKQLNRFLQERGAKPAHLQGYEMPAASAVWEEACSDRSAARHVEWVRGLDPNLRQRLGQAMAEVADSVAHYAEQSGW